jgi:hypothetical protein
MREPRPPTLAMGDGSVGDPRENDRQLQAIVLYGRP